MGNPITWFDVNGPAPEKAAEFYSHLFSWEIQEAPGYDYRMIDTHAGSGINGGIARQQEGQAPASLIHAQGPETQALLDKAVSLGGRVAMPVTENEMVTYAMFVDPWGNTVGLVKGPEDEVRPPSPGDNPPVDWFEMACSDPKKAWAFYRVLFGWEIKESEGDGYLHGSIDSGNGGARGGIGSTMDGQPHITLYAHVDDPAKYVERAESLGAVTTLPISDIGEGTVLAHFTDTQGTTFGVYATKG